MSPYEILAIGGLVSIAVAMIAIVMTRQTVGSAALAAALSGGFAAYTTVTVLNEGADILWANHTSNLWGVQVWWDLLFALGIGLFLIAPRARKVGMNMPLWTVLIAATASIALLAMCARLFWLEKQAEAGTTSA